MKNYTITILGCGTMGRAVASAILNTSFNPYPSRIIACTNTEASSNKLKESWTHPILEYSHGLESNRKAIEQADVIILGCKPYMFATVVEEVGDCVKKDALLISLLAGTTINELENLASCVAKVMTNTPAQFGCGTAAVSLNKLAERDAKDLVMKLVSPIGEAVLIPEKNMDAATALVGSGPAFCLMMMESLVDGGVRMGLPFDVARLAAAKVMEGTARMALETGEHPAVLKSRVCTPGGTTIGGLLKMEDAGVRGGIARGVEEAARISASFAK